MEHTNKFDVSIEEVLRELECIKAVAVAEYTKECLQFAIDKLEELDAANSV